MTWLDLDFDFCTVDLLTSALHCRHRPSEVELLFQLLRVFTIRHVPDFHFLRKFLDETVAKVSMFFLSCNVRHIDSKSMESLLLHFT